MKIKKYEIATNIINLYLFNFCFIWQIWLWSNQHPDAVHIHDICLQFHDFIKIELYVQKFKFRHNIVPTNFSAQLNETFLRTNLVISTCQHKILL